MAWHLEMATEVRDWLHEVRKNDRTSARLVGQAIQALVDEGPDLGRPLVDRVKGSSRHNLKELRPGSTGSTVIRGLFIFDPERSAVLLVVGDKSGQWSEWYRCSIPVAEARYAEWLAYLEQRRKEIEQ